MIKVLFAGDFDPEYNRTKILLTGLKQLEAVEAIVYTFKGRRDFNAIKFQSLESEADVIFLPSFSHGTANFIIAKATIPVVFDPLISKYLTKVFDYKQVNRYSLRAFKNFKKDQTPMRNCDLLISDTEAHKTYYSETFKIPLEKISVLPVGADCDEYLPSDNGYKSAKYVVGFYGGFIPLQGVRVILEAANILKSNTDIVFHLIGTGFEFEEMKKLASEKSIGNVHFLGWKKPEELPEELDKFNVCLGIFGDTIKSRLVVPNKIYHYGAKAKPIITMESPAISEFFTDQENCLLIKPSPENLSKAILRLKSNPILGEEIGQNARRLIQESLCANEIASRFVNIIKSVV